MMAIVSTKGGVGKSTVTANIANALIEEGFHVGALDLDSSSPTLHLALGMEVWPQWGVISATSQIIPTKLENGLELVTMASKWGKGNRVSWRGNDKGKLTRELLNDNMGEVAWDKDIEYIIVDSPPSMSEEIFILAESDAIEGYVIVTQPQPMSVADIDRLVDYCRDVQLPIFGVVSNFDGCLTPQGEVFYPYLGEWVDIKKWSESKGLPFLQSIPQSSNIEPLKPIYRELATKIIASTPVLLPRYDKRKLFRREALKIIIKGGEHERDLVPTLDPLSPNNSG